MGKKKLTGGLALAALAAGGCGDSPQEQFEDAARKVCRSYLRCYGYSPTSSEIDECADDLIEDYSSLSDDCLEAYAIILDCYADVVGDTCGSVSDSELAAACGSEFGDALELCPSIDF